MCTAHHSHPSTQAASSSAAPPAKGAAAAAVLPPRPPPNPLMLGLSPEAYVLRSVSSVRANDLEQALLLLPFADALKLMQWVAAWLAQGNQVRACCVCLACFNLCCVCSQLMHAALLPLCERTRVHVWYWLRSSLTNKCVSADLPHVPHPSTTCI